MTPVAQLAGDYDGGANALARCDLELAQIEAELRAGNPDVEGLLLALGDWEGERQLIEEER